MQSGDVNKPAKAKKECKVVVSVTVSVSAPTNLERIRQIGEAAYNFHSTRHGMVY